MNQSWNRFGVLVAVGALAIGTLAFMGRVHGYADKDDKAPVSGPRYTVVETEGHNLIVTDNQSNSLYFYTVDKGKAPGSELKLRAKVDLTKVGQPSITPVDVNIQK